MLGEGNGSSAITITTQDDLEPIMQELSEVQSEVGETCLMITISHHLQLVQLRTSAQQLESNDVILKVC